jgi:hypothetical protein
VRARHCYDRRCLSGGKQLSAPLKAVHIILLLLHGLLDGPRALPMATDKLGSFKNIL